MKYIKLFEEFIIEKSGDSYSSGCAMIYFSFPEIKNIHDMIEEVDLYTQEGDRTFGLEDEPHVTLLYGLDETVTPQQVKEIVDKFTFSTCKIHNASLFENEYDVLKFDVEGDSLHECNEELKKLPHNNSYSEYHPHLTIAYLKKGKGQKYTDMLKNKEWELKPQSVVFSQPDDTKNKIEIKVK